MKIIGMISGTSVDAIDAALVDVEGAPPDMSLVLQSFISVPFSAAQKEQIFQLFDPQSGTVDRICTMNFVVGEWFAAVALQLLEEAGLTPQDIDLIASHGQTIYHDVGPQVQRPSTLQIGESAVIAARTGITTIADFRVADVVAGGQGAPLVSYLDWLFLRSATHARAVQNIGGIGNVTYLPPASEDGEALGFDTGPGNMIIDYVVGRATDGAATFDRDGRLALQGRVHQGLLAELLAHPYLHMPLPKTTGREQFGDQFGAQVWQRARALDLAKEDIVATVTAFTAHSIAHAYRSFLPKMPREVIVGGGGASNPALLQMLSQALGSVEVHTHKMVGINDDAKEAIVFALLAHEAIHGRQGNLPASTAARYPAVLGKVTPGDNYNKLLQGIFSCQTQT